MACLRWRIAPLLGLTALALAPPSTAGAARPNIDRVTVSRGAEGLLSFRISFEGPLTSTPDTLQVAIDADRDSTTGVDGLEYSLDNSGPFLFDDVSLLTAVNGEPVASHPAGLRFQHVGIPSKDGVSSATFSIPASLIGDPRRFDFYVFVEEDGALDEAPSHVLFTAGSLPWTFPKHSLGTTSLAETYEDGSDITLHERPEIVLPVIGAMLLAGAGLVVAIVWGSRRRGRSRLRAELASLPSALTRECPHCQGTMRRDSALCAHCGRESPPWMLHEGSWWCYVDGTWYWLDGATNSWIRFESNAPESEPLSAEPAPQL